MPRFSFDNGTGLAVLLWLMLIGSTFVLMWWNKTHAASTKRIYVVGMTFFSVWAALSSLLATAWYYNDLHHEEVQRETLAQIISSYGLDPYATYPISTSHQDNVSHVELNTNIYGASTLSAGSDSTAVRRCGSVSTSRYRPSSSRSGSSVNPMTTSQSWNNRRQATRYRCRSLCQVM